MQLSRTIRIVVAAGFLLLFSLQAGLGLYFHAVFHTGNAIAATEQHGPKKTLSVSAEGSGFSCSCVDDFLVPFYAAKTFSLPQPVAVFFIAPQADYYNYLPHSLRIFRSLRAPPVFVS